MIVKLLTEHHLEFLSLKGGCRKSSESTHVKMPNSWKFQALAQMVNMHRFLESVFLFSDLPSLPILFQQPTIQGYAQGNGL